MGVYKRETRDSYGVETVLYLDCVGEYINM